MAWFNIPSHQRRAPDVRRSREEIPLHGDWILSGGSLSSRVPMSHSISTDLTRTLMWDICLVYSEFALLCRGGFEFLISNQVLCELTSQIKYLSLIKVRHCFSLYQKNSNSIYLVTLVSTGIRLIMWIKCRMSRLLVHICFSKLAFILKNEIKVLDIGINKRNVLNSLKY